MKPIEVTTHKKIITPEDLFSFMHEVQNRTFIVSFEEIVNAFEKATATNACLSTRKEK